MGEIFYNNDNFLSNFPPCLRENIMELCLNSQVGLTTLKFTDITPFPTKRFGEETALNFTYHFVLKIPYAGRFLNWDLIFNPEDYSFAPDFDFNDDYFLARPDVDTVVENIPSLVNWNVKNPNSLSSLLKDLVSYFKKCQLEKLQNENIYSRIFNEYCLLTCEDGIPPDNVEVLTENNCVHFLITIKVDYSQLPEYVQPPEVDETGILLNPGEDYANLKVSFMKLDGSRVNVYLQLSSRLEQVIGNHKLLHIPQFTKDSSLVEYVPLIASLLKDRIDQVARHHKLKREYVTCLSTIRNQSLVEYDAETFSKAAFICEVDDYYCLIQVEIGDNFPHEKPLVKLCSLYCLHNGKPCERIENYPYSPQWSCDQMIQRLLGHLADAIPKFKMHKH